MHNKITVDWENTSLHIQQNSEKFVFTFDVLGQFLRRITRTNTLDKKCQKQQLLVPATIYI